MIPKKAAMRAVTPLAFVEKPAELDVVVVDELDVVEDAPPDGAVAVGLGRPKPEKLPVKGPGSAEADAPCPTRKPTFCDGLPVCCFAAAR